MWIDGRHSDRHSAGEDLSERMVNAPHDEEVLAQFPIVGELIPEAFGNRFVANIQRAHLHPMIVHFSESCPMLAALFVFVFVFVSQVRTFEVMAYYLIILGFFSSIGCMVTGFFSWIVGYERTLTTIFSRKIIFSFMLTAIISVLSAWRTLDRGVLTHMDKWTPVYAALVLVMVPVVIVLGHYGGRIVYG